MKPHMTKHVVAEKRDETLQKIRGHFADFKGNTIVFREGIPLINTLQIIEHKKTYLKHWRAVDNIKHC